MALLQISEPGMSAEPHQHRLAVGIDLGTTHSLVATVRSGAAESLCPTPTGRVLLPSAVRYGAGRRARRGRGRARAGRRRSGATPWCRSSASWAVGVKDVTEVRARMPYHFVDAPGMVAMRDRGGIQARRCRCPRTSSRACASGPRRAWGDSSPGPWSRCRPTSTMPSARPPRTRRSSRPGRCCACSTSPRPPRSPTAWTTRSEGTYAIYRPRRRHLRPVDPRAHSRRVRGALDQRRLGAGRRRLRPSPSRPTGSSGAPGPRGRLGPRTRAGCRSRRAEVKELLTTARTRRRGM
jgi:hypothetical protein